jgi:PAS domain S-box-containing protein
VALRPQRPRIWLAASLALLAALFGVDVATGSALVLVPAFGVAPVLASLGARHRATAASGAATVVLAVVGLAVQDDLTTGQGLVRLLTVALLSALAWWAALQRDRRERLAIDNAALLVEASERQVQLQEAFGLLDVLFERAPVGLAFFDRELRYVRVNEHVAEMHGVPAEAHVGHTITELLPGLDPAVQSCLEGVLETGEPATEVEVVGETPGRPGVQREFSESFWPVRRHGHGGEVIGVGKVVFEVTEPRAAERALREQTARYETLLLALSEVGEAMIVLEDGRVVHANEAFAAMTGYSQREIAELPSIYDLMPEEQRQRVHRRAALRLAGRVGPGAQLSLRHRDGRMLALEVASARLDVQGRHQLVTVARDVTARARAEVERERLLQHARFLAEASAAFDAVLDEDRTLQSMARLSVRELADTCVVLLADKPGSIRRVAAVAHDPADEDRLREMLERYPFTKRRSHPLFDVLRTGESRLVVHGSDIEAMAQDERHLELIRAFPMLSTVIVPLIARGRTLGAMALGFRAIVEQDSVALFEDLARRAALAMDNARLYAERDAVARTLQRSLLPTELPEIPGMELAARYVAAGEGNEVGGDFYDCFPTRDGDWALVIGDVCGKGADAAVITALARYTLRASAMLHADDPAEILGELNDAILRQSSDPRFCTVLYVSLSPAGGGLTACVATGGHPLPLVLRDDGSVETAGRPGTLLGILPDPEISVHAIDLGPGDALILYTDGVTEASPLDDAFGPEPFASFVAGCAGDDADAIARRIEEAALEIQGGTPRDDVAVVVLRVSGGRKGRFGRAGAGVAAGP